MTLSTTLRTALRTLALLLGVAVTVQAQVVIQVDPIPCGSTQVTGRVLTTDANRPLTILVKEQSTNHTVVETPTDYPLNPRAHTQHQHHLDSWQIAERRISSSFARTVR